jgi:N,N'-diacetyllegionaminate synthase
MNNIYHIIEVANVHAGKEDYLLKLIDEFGTLKGIHGIKFQPFKFDKIALEDFSWYEVYKELYFEPAQWKNIIDKAAKYWDIWIDTFDDYSFEVAQKNIDKVYGFKFQASTLYNKNLVNLFSQLDLSQKKIILNISGLEVNQIKEVIENFGNKLKPREIILQIGFQSYPTQLIDSGLIKIKTIQQNFSNQISFADHIAPEEEDCTWLPVMAFMQGAKYIEKHICLSGEKPKYDHYSSMNKDQYAHFLLVADKYSTTLTQPFVNENEAKYLSGSIQIPVLKKDTGKGRIPNLETDFDFKRSNQEGLRAHEIEAKVKDFYLLAKDKKARETLQETDLKRAKIATIIACRLKSTRLPQKAILKIGELSSVELCIKNCLRFEHVDHTILATSTTDEDAPLKDYTYDKKVIFHKGDPEDVIRRYLDVINKMEIDVIVRVTADMQYVSNDITQILLKSHFEKGADFTRATHAAIGTNVEIISTSALKYAKSFFPEANYSEYMSWYFVNNPEHFKLNFVDLPKELVRDYRLTLDHPEDLELFQKIEEHFATTKQDFSITELFRFLDAHPEVANLNAHIGLKYKTDQSLIDTLNKVTKINS